MRGMRGAWNNSRRELKGIRYLVVLVESWFRKRHFETHILKLFDRSSVSIVVVRYLF